MFAGSRAGMTFLGGGADRELYSTTGEGNVGVGKSGAMVEFNWSHKIIKICVCHII